MRCFDQTLVVENMSAKAFDGQAFEYKRATSHEAIEPDTFPQLLYTLLCDGKRVKTDPAVRTGVENVERRLIKDIRERERIREEGEIPKVGT